MCFGLWESYDEPPVQYWEQYYTGAGATLSTLTGASIKELSRVTRMDATAQMDLYDVTTFFHGARYDYREVIPSYTREEFKKEFVSRFMHELGVTVTPNWEKLRMKMPVGWLYKQPRIVNRKTGMVQQVGQMVVLECWIKEKCSIGYELFDYRTVPQGKLILLPQDEQVDVFWRMNPIFYIGT